MLSGNHQGMASKNFFSSKNHLNLTHLRSSQENYGLNNGGEEHAPLHTPSPLPHTPRLGRPIRSGRSFINNSMKRGRRLRLSRRANGLPSHELDNLCSRLFQLSKLSLRVFDSHLVPNFSCAMSVSNYILIDESTHRWTVCRTDKPTLTA